MHRVLKGLLVFVLFAWGLRIMHFAIFFPWNLEGIRGEMSDSAWSAGHYTWDQTIRFHVAWVIVTLVVVAVFILTKKKQYSSKSSDRSA